MRGKVDLARKSKADRRITPAYAGKRSGLLILRFCIQDHPRLCGEKFLNIRRNPCNLGSPPPMRGKALFFSAVPRVVGITPAYAGKSSFYSHLAISI